MAKDKSRPNTSTVPEIDPDTAGTEKSFPPPEPKNFPSGPSNDYPPPTLSGGPGQDPSIEQGTETAPRDPENPERPAGEPEDWQHSVGPSAGGASTVSTVSSMRSTSGDIDRQDFRRPR
ncbi:MAG: hypothetical protein JWM88_288 [Verrucomicrobia bacterium]|nr:hypothetical protein [Verrucomicrobiota bacterium]